MKKRKLDLSKYGILFAWIALIIIFAVCEPTFLKTSNIFNILRQVSIVGVCSVGMTFVILTGGMDLSVGSVIGVAAVAGALMLSKGIPIPAVIIAILLVGAAAGAFNAFFINEVGIAPIIMTLGTMTALRGAAFLLCGGFPVYGITKSFLLIGQGYIGVVPIPVLIMIAAFIAGYIFLNRLPFGRSVYGIGGNIEAARLSGINVKRVLYKVYILAGALYALAGLMLMARVNSGQAASGEGYEMDVITGCVLGGISISGGEGKITGVVTGVLLMGTLSNGMVLMDVSEYWQKVVKGLVLILAVTLDKTVQKGKTRKAEL
ncbi:ABC transporter permease [[Clostridium] hylemonae]|uniref:ABC transporter permease n=1 Tax=[Clostridium] hylemonae TaxID=89153 RepID=UPI001FCCAD4F|nr:ABC transporter permease [[Clostridium] hylemonae]BDF03634.1 ribose import permease protein RbsC [[Clostridium] hylemonae]